MKGDKFKNKIGDASLSQFVLSEKLGQGTFGKVRLGTHIATGEKVAVKILEKNKIQEQEDKMRIEREIKILKMLRHNNLIQLYSVIQTPSQIYLIMEYSKGKDLFNYIVQNKRISEPEACLFFQQIIDGVTFLHRLKICHRDLKPENLLLENKTLKLIDFGLSNLYGKDMMLGTACGSPSYAAPEMLTGNPYNGLKSDIWSCGVCLYAMVCGFLPFEDPNQENLYRKILEGRYALPSFVSDNCKDLIRRIMCIDLDSRYTLEDIKNHPWYKQLTPKINEGLSIHHIILPIDQDIVDELGKKGFDKKQLRSDIIANKHNHYTTTYYLTVKSRSRQGITSVSDLVSEAYVSYIKDNSNLLSSYQNNLKDVIAKRKSSVNLNALRKSSKKFSSKEVKEISEGNTEKKDKTLLMDAIIENFHNQSKPAVEENDSDDDEDRDEKANSQPEAPKLPLEKDVKPSKPFTKRENGNDARDHKNFDYRDFESIKANQRETKAKLEAQKAKLWKMRKDMYKNLSVRQPDIINELGVFSYKNSRKLNNKKSNIQANSNHNTIEAKPYKHNRVSSMPNAGCDINSLVYSV